MSMVRDLLLLDSALEDLAESLAPAATLTERYKKVRPDPDAPVGGLNPGRGANIGRLARRLSMKVRRNANRTKHWYARARTRGVAREGAPFPGFKAGSRVRAITFLGFPVPKLMKTSMGRRLVAELDKKWREKGLEVNLTPDTEKGETEFYQVKNAGRLNLADEVEVLLKVFPIRRKDIKVTDSEGNVRKRQQTAQEVAARIEAEGLIDGLRAGEDLTDLLIRVMALVAVGGPAGYKLWQALKGVSLESLL